MSANIYYRQVKPIDGKDLAVFGPSSFIRSLEQAFGRFPCELGKKDIETLKGMAAVSMDGAEDKYGNPYTNLIEAIEKLGVIEVYAEY